MKNTKTRIIKKALELYNTRGISNVSSKAIALELGISDGNLRYHYKNKEAILITILKRMIEDLHETEKNFSIEQTIDRAFFFNTFRNAYEVTYHYRCIFIDQVYLHKEFPLYFEDFSAYVQMWRTKFLALFDYLLAQNIFKTSFSKQQYKDLFEQVYMFSNSWYFYKEQEPDKNLDYFANIGASIFTPYWTHPEAV
ncbi:TetR/AcrR family transcriptional regulator [Aquimarina rhabdastrellae]